jgi:hypothetical protein
MLVSKPENTSHYFMTVKYLVFNPEQSRLAKITKCGPERKYKNIFRVREPLGPIPNVTNIKHN